MKSIKNEEDSETENINNEEFISIMNERSKEMKKHNDK
jgi:hypothetical protein